MPLKRNTRTQQESSEGKHSARTDNASVRLKPKTGF